MGKYHIEVDEEYHMYIEKPLWDEGEEDDLFKDTEIPDNLVKTLRDARTSLFEAEQAIVAHVINTDQKDQLIWPFDKLPAEELKGE